MSNQSSEIKVIVFDCFGVISSEVYWPWLRKVMPNYKNHQSEFERISHQADTGNIDIVEYVAQISKFTGIREEDVLPSMEQLIIINHELIDLIAKLKQDYHIGIITDANYTFFEKLLADNNLSHYFDEIVISSRVQTTKAESKIFQIFMDKMNVQPSEMVFIDDNPKNVERAEELGIHGITYADMTQLTGDLNKLI